MISSFVNWGLDELSEVADDGTEAAASEGTVDRKRKAFGCRNATTEDTHRVRRNIMLNILRCSRFHSQVRHTIIRLANNRHTREGLL